MVLLVMASELSYASNATDCVALGSNSVSQTLTNNCHHKIEIAWCHTFTGHGYKTGLCKNYGVFYQLYAVLDPGEAKENQYSLAHDSTIHYAACSSGYTLKQSGMDGHFQCE